jgi:hypothetical protein
MTSNVAVVVGLVVVVVALAVVCGLLVNRRKPDATQVEEQATPIFMVGNWVGPGDIVGRVATLAVLLVAFSIVQGNVSYRGAASGANAEANAVRNMFELTDYVPEPQREHLQAATLCYARAVHHLEWKTMSDGEPSPVVTAWTGRIRDAFAELAIDKPPFTTLLSDNRDREQARRQRIADASPTIPVTVFWLMVVAIAISLGWLAFQLPRVKNRRPFIIALGLYAAFLSAGLLVSVDLDAPFAGLAQVKPEAITSTEQDITTEFVAHHGADSPPCDDQGHPTHAAPATVPSR